MLGFKLIKGVPEANKGDHAQSDHFPIAVEAYGKLFIWTIKN